MDICIQNMPKLIDKNRSICLQVITQSYLKNAVLIKTQNGKQVQLIKLSGYTLEAYNSKTI